MRIGRRPRVVRIGGADVRLARTPEGVIELWGRDDRELAAGLGFAHAHDRMVQMMLVRLVGQGRLSECLRSDAGNLAIDLFVRGVGFRPDPEALDPPARALVEAYCEGVNTYLTQQRRPFELWLVGYHPEPWTPADTLLTLQVMSFVGLAQTQQDMEKLIIQALQQGVDIERLKQLFRPHLDAVDGNLLELIRKLHLSDGLVPPAVRFLSTLPRLIASNNWALSSARSASGKAMQANDPHLECNRLPAIWYEYVGHTADDYRLGVSMPGIPGLVMGRTRALSFGFTYGFMDTVDYFIEECRGGRYRRGDDWIQFKPRPETIHRRGKPGAAALFRETDCGVLECEPLEPVQADGFYLSRAWSGRLAGSAGSLNALVRLLGARSVVQGQHAVRDVTISCNWLLADRHGRIAYQQSGPLPLRQHSGLHPVPGWRPEMAWKGLASQDALASQLDPPDGLLVTANEDRNQKDKPLSINLPMGGYRAGRILELLRQKDRHTLEDLKQIQRDLHSPQAERYMAMLRPWLPATPVGQVLLDWDLRYDRASRGATLFEEFYAAVLREVFGGGLFGFPVWDRLVSETSLLADYFHLFDEALLGEDPVWFGAEGRQILMRRVLAAVLLRHRRPDAIKPWGLVQRVRMTNIFFQGKLPRLLGFDHGPIALEGSRATVVQGALFHAHGRTTSFCPSWRYLTDMGTDTAHTALAGGPSGRRTSPHYTTDLRRWLSYGYKVLTPRK